ncbi:hypothetical protein LTR86_008961 [Recurvomyces mirabilis]|nr:hypothetical protein LTR86_008961 [Recurvomyces mirabilis]
MERLDVHRVLWREGSVHSLLFLIFLAAIVLPSSVYAVYALQFHPLAKYPGPLLGRLTQCYDLYHAFQGDKHVLLYQLHKKYGPVVRFSPNTISINDPVALRSIYAHGANVKKSIFYECFRAAPQAISTLLATDKTHHARKRRVMAQAFSAEALRGLEQYVMGRIEDLIERMNILLDQTQPPKSQSTVTLNMANYLNYLVFDIMGELVFGRSFGTLGDKPENRDAIRLLGRAARRNYTVAAMPVLAQYGVEKYLPFLRGLYRDRAKYLAFGKGQVLARAKENGLDEGGRRDIFSYLLHAQDPETGTGFPMPELFMEGNTLIVAGSDTSSTTMSAVMFYLLTNADAMSRLKHEVLSTFQNVEEICTGPKMQTCSWLRACIDEAMRMSPAVAGLLPREVMEGGFGISELGLFLPAGVQVGVSSYVVQHNEDYVRDPFKYDPGRWLHEDEKLPELRQDKEALNSVFCPFSLGSRACLGKPLVYMELSITLARLVWEYDMRLAPERRPRPAIAKQIKQGIRHPAEYQYQDWFLSNNEDVVVEISRRQR